MDFMLTNQLKNKKYNPLQKQSRVQYILKDGEKKFTKKINTKYISTWL